MQKRLEHLDEAQNELMLVDEDDATRYLVGECFLHVGNEDAEEQITRGAAIAILDSVNVGPLMLGA